MNGTVVSNTGPLIALALINRVDVLQSLFAQVIVPEAVHQEILQGGAFRAGLASYRQAHWIKVQSVQSPLDPLLQTVLHIGEASVIQLAREVHAEFVLIDEKKARKIARIIFGLRVIGSARVLIEAKNRGIIESVGNMLELIRGNGYWIHDDIIDLAKRMAGER